MIRGEKLAGKPPIPAFKVIHPLFPIRNWCLTFRVFSVPKVSNLQVLLDLVIKTRTLNSVFSPYTLRLTYDTILS
jgi:hypothetical protein